MINEITIKPIGIIRTPYKTHKEIPIQGKFKPETKASVELYKEYVPGLKDLDGFSYVILLYYFHDTTKVPTAGVPFLEDDEHGIFAIRSPHRPNHIGLSAVKVESIKGNVLHFTNVDMLDGTPLLDIKPYVTHFDCFNDAKCGWIDKHFKNGKTPARAVKGEGV